MGKVSSAALSRPLEDTVATALRALEDSAPLPAVLALLESADLDQDQVWAVVRILWAGWALAVASLQRQLSRNVNSPAWVASAARAVVCLAWGHWEARQVGIST